MNRRIVSFALLASFTFLAGCSGDDTTAAGGDAGGTDATRADGATADSGGGVDSSPGTDSSTDTGTSDTGTGSDASDGGGGGDADAAPAVVNNCTTFEDHTAANDARAIAFGGANGLAYVPACMQIRVGQTVTWNGDFSFHPLAAFNGDANNPIQTTTTGTSQPFTFPSAGTFGFHCQVHAPMIGAIRVVP